MAEVVCDTSPLQYLHQLRLLHLLPSLATSIVVPPAVEEEILAGQARQVAESLEIPFIGTLGLLLEAKKSNLISSVAPFLDQLQELRFRLSSGTRSLVLRLAGERD